MTTDTVSSTTTSTTSDYTATNPNAELDKDAFLMLLLTELQYQDPTDPMDSDKMLTQTSQLATLETQENTNAVMEQLANQLESTMNMYSLSGIGKMASVGSNAIVLEEDSSTSFEVYFEKAIKSGNLYIKDVNGNTVRTVPLEASDAGIHAFEWDGTDDSGNQLSAGYYSVTAEYLDTDLNQQTAQFGVYPVESVRMDGTDTYVKLGSSYVPLEYIVEFY